MPKPTFASAYNPSHPTSNDRARHPGLSPLTPRLVRKLDMFLNIRQTDSRSINLNTLFEIPNAQQRFK